MFTRLANPARFLGLADRLLPWLAGATVLAFAGGLAWGLVLSPPDYQQGDTVRIMYVHVPAAWLALSIYLFMAAASVVGLVWKHPLADLAAKSAAPIGAAFCLIALVTGSLWGAPMWGAWWRWDPRLTSMLVLFFLYLGYLALWAAIEAPDKAAQAAAILAIVGAVNVPIVKFSVDWWSSLHQPASVMRMGGPTIDPSILWPLLLNAAAFHLYVATVLIWRLKAELIGRRLRALGLAIAEQT